MTQELLNLGFVQNAAFIAVLRKEVSETSSITVNWAYITTKSDKVEDHNGGIFFNKVTFINLPEKTEKIFRYNENALDYIKSILNDSTRNA